MAKRNITKLLGGLFFSVFFIVALYLFVQITKMTTPNYSYETVIEYSFTDSITAQGYVLFEETFVEGSGSIGFLVEEGSRVSAGEAIAECYTNDTQPLLRIELDETNASLSLLYDSQNTSGALVDNLVSQRNTALYALLEQLDKGEYTDTQSSEDSFLLAQNKIQVTTGIETDFTAQIETLSARVETLTESLSGLSTITSPTNGYFVSKNTAQFLSYTMDELLEMSVADFSDSLKTTNEVSSDSYVGKVVSSYTWYFVGVCSLEESGSFKVGSSVELTFPDTTDTIFPASVISLEEDESTGLMRVTLACEYIGADALALGQETAEIILATYVGLRVPVDAIRMQDQVAEDGTVESIKGIYVAYNGVARFRAVEVIYQTDDYILVPLEGQSSNSQIKLYDQVIISGTDVTDGKLL